jgi:23S rRNA A1618 N6-methylase RlmF
LLEKQEAAIAFSDEIRFTTDFGLTTLILDFAANQAHSTHPPNQFCPPAPGRAD